MSEIKAHPLCPPEILAEQVALTVLHRNFNGHSALGTIEVSRAVANDVTAFFRQAFRLRFPIEKVVRASEFDFDDEELMAANATSGFNYRTVAGTQILSKHAVGRAFDVNPRLNPYVRYTKNQRRLIQPPDALWDPMRPGTLHADHPLVEFMQQRDWVWGGSWIPSQQGRVDYQHFEKSESA